MIPVDRLNGVKSVCYHESCPDGTASAMIISAAFRSRPEPKFISLQYGTELMNGLAPDHGQLFVDITPPKDRWNDWKEYGPIVLDHHETAKHVVLSLDGIYGENETHSGARLAFENVMLAMRSVSILTSQEIMAWDKFAKNAMIRDTWKKNDPCWRDACAQALSTNFYGSKNLIEKSRNTQFNFDEFTRIGYELLQSNERRTQLLAKNAVHEEISDGQKTWRVAFFNCTEKLISDVANYLIETGSDIAVGYFYLNVDGQQKMSVSIRTGGQVSASGIAKVFGGGGHPCAAGFSISHANSTPPSMLGKLIEQGLVALR